MGVEWEGEGGLGKSSPPPHLPVGVGGIRVYRGERSSLGLKKKKRTSLPDIDTERKIYRPSKTNNEAMSVQ